MHAARWPLALAAGVLVPSCGDAGPPVCPDLAAECPEGCREVTALAYDEAAACLLASGVVGCADRQIDLTQVECRKRLVDGELFLFPNLAPFGLTNWGECSNDETAVVQAAMPCQ